MTKGKRHSTKISQKSYIQENEPKGEEIKQCSRCGRTMPLKTKLEYCPYCGGQIETGEK